MNDKSRSAAADEVTLPLWPELAPPPGTPPSTRGVGGRQGGSGPRQGGGGYLNGRTPPEFRKDIRLRELSEIGLSKIWLDIAAAVGYDQFIGIWKNISSKPELRDDSNQVALTIRPFRAYERYQRNRYIDTLVAAGLRPSQVHEVVRHDLGENLTVSQITRLCAAARAKV